MLLLLAATYLLGEAWVVAGWEGRPYRWTVDAISALGVPEAQHWAGEESRSTRHAAMNAIFVGSGVRVLLAGAVLAPFVERDRLYLTDHAHERWTGRARVNLRRELDRLSGASPR